MTTLTLQPEEHDESPTEIELETLHARLWEFYGEATGTACSQARDMMQRYYGNNFQSYTHYFLEPMISLLKEIKEIYHKSCEHRQNWPFSIRGCVLLHLSEISQIELSSGDFYFCVGQDSSRSGQFQFILRYHNSAGIRESVFLAPESSTETVAMDLVNRFRDSNDEDLGQMLKNCLVVFEDSVERLKWDEVVSPCQDCRRNRVTSHITNRHVYPKSQTSSYLCLSEGNVNGMTDQRGGHSRSPGPGGGGGNQHDPGGQRSPGPGFYRHRALDCPQTILDVDYQLLQSGICILPGCRDLEGRSVVFIFTSSCIWQNQQVSSVELARHLMYYRSVPREDVRCKGMTVVANVQGASVSTINILLEALYLFEGNCRGGIAVIHLLADEQSQGLVQRSPVYDSHTPFKLDILLTEELLTEFISLDQLPLVLDGLFVYNHEEWIRFHMELDPFVSKIRTVAKYLVCIMQELSEVETMPKTSKESGQLIEHHQHLVKSAFKDQRFVSLQAEGESIINCLRREDLHMGHSEDYRDSMESVNKLYDHLNNTMVKLVHLADSRLTKLERCLQLREFEEECTKIIEWTTRDGEEFLCRHAQLADNLKGIKSQQKEFEKFYFQAMTHIEKGNDLLEEASLLAQSGNFDEATGTYEWALEAMKYAASMKMEHCESFSGLEKLLQSLELYLRDHPVMKPETFENMFHLAGKVKK
ncbi:hypothetical protein FSP39_012335 [Pinctada imbricata]|uniref:Uncharacterized protein n=1 Tax=Pinctada imbricata TaxID=66713 RepID=A0AA89BX99_PINIB|nr:hypothetical protein FSP39_012335 [Pinctada imbricata]